MKSKIILGILVVLVVFSSVMNIYQYNLQNQLNRKLQSIQAEYDSLNETYDSMLDKISEKENEISALSEEAENLKSAIQIQQSENDSLKKQIENLQVESAAVETVEEVPTPVETPQVVDPTPESSTTPINPNIGAPLQPGETFNDGWGGDGAIYVGDTSGQF